MRCEMRRASFAVAAFGPPAWALFLLGCVPEGRGPVPATQRPIYTAPDAHVVREVSKEKRPPAALPVNLARTLDRAKGKRPSAAMPANWLESLGRAFGNEELSKDELLDVIRSLHALAEAGPAARQAEETVASLLMEDARGKILSRWCFRALAMISGDPDRYVQQYMAAAGWRHSYAPVKAGEAGVVDGPRPDMVGPEIPEELRAASRLAWIKGVEAAIRLLVGSEDAERTRHVTEVLRKMGAPEDVIVPRLAKVILDRTVRSWTREHAANLVGTYGTSAASMDRLLAGLKVEDPRVRGACARSLGKLADAYDFYGSLPGRHPRPKEAVGALLGALKDPDGYVRGKAIWGLADMGCEAVAAVDALVEIVESDTDPCRWAAARALGQIGGSLRARRPEAFAEVAKVAMPAIMKALRIEPIGHRNNHIVSEAAKSVGSFGRAASPAVPELRRLLRYEAPKSAAKSREMVSFRIGDKTYRKELPSFSPALLRRVRWAVLESLGRIGPAAADAVPDILACADDARLRHNIAVALGRIGRGGREVEKVLLDLTQAKEHWIRREAAKSLGLVARESEQIIKALERLRHDKDDQVREEAAKAVFAIHARATGADDPGADDVF